MAPTLDSLAELLVYALEVYTAAGLLFAVVFVSQGVQRLDSEAQDSGVGFRFLIAPGVVALWPLFLSRWLRGRTEPAVEKNPHRLVAKEP